MSTYIGSTVAGWWRDLQPSDTSGGGGRSVAQGRVKSGDRGALARLRRCASVMDAACEPITIALCRKLGARESDLAQAALTAAVLAHVREDNPATKVARQIGLQADGSAVMSDLRFRRLLQAETEDERLIAFRRLVTLARRTLNVSNLAEGLWNWSDERQRRTWIYAYYNAPDVQAQTTALPAAIEDASA